VQPDREREEDCSTMRRRVSRSASRSGTEGRSDQQRRTVTEWRSPISPEGRGTAGNEDHRSEVSIRLRHVGKLVADAWGGELSVRKESTRSRKSRLPGGQPSGGRALKPRGPDKSALQLPPTAASRWQ